MGIGFGHGGSYSVDQKRERKNIDKKKEPQKPGRYQGKGKRTTQKNTKKCRGKYSRKGKCRKRKFKRRKWKRKRGKKYGSG